MPLLLSTAAAIGLSLAVAFTGDPSEQKPPQDSFTWEGMEQMVAQVR